MKIDLMRSILEQFNQILKSKGVELGVVIIPSYPNIVDLSEFPNIGMDEEYFEEFMEDEKRFFGPEDIVAGSSQPPLFMNINQRCCIVKGIDQPDIASNFAGLHG